MQIIKKENWIVEMFDRDVWMIIFRLKSETNFSKILDIYCVLKWYAEKKRDYRNHTLKFSTLYKEIQCKESLT